MSSRKHKRSNVEERLPPAKRESRTGTKRSHPDPLTCAEDDVDDDEVEKNSEMELELSQLSSHEFEEGTLSFKEAEAGVLDKVELFDFMCHKHLDLSLSPNVNFILGRNGSGKSAIMTGIVVALGGKARSTERGSSLKQFIRTGASNSKVLVHLRNRGHEAYKPEEYGDTIICERVIKEDGTTAYKIKSENGKLISSKKEELVAITDHCNIQIDNPVSLLNQDTSRNFLQNSKPTSKYKLFMKATHLEQIAIDYQQSREEQTLMEQRIGSMAASLPEMRNEAKKLEEIVESFKRFTEMEDKIKQLENELKWAIVVEMEAILPPIEANIDKERRRIPRNKEKANTAQNTVSSAKQEIKDTNKGLTEVTKEINQLSEERSVIASEKRKKNQEFRHQSDAILKQIGKKIGDALKEKSALEKAKQEAILSSQRDVKGEREARLKEIEGLEEQIRRVNEEISTAETEKSQFQAAQRRADELIQSHRAKEGNMQGQVQTCETQLKRLRSSRSDKMAAFGEDMRTLVNELQRNKRQFRKLPKGPIGSMIQVKDPKWCTAIEQVFKFNTLKVFVVDNQQDAKKFRAIAERVVRRGPIPEAIISRFQDTVYDVRRNHAQSSYPAVFDMLDVSDSDVMNVLIDQFHVEKVLLIEEREAANRIMTHETPHNAKSAYTLSGDLVEPSKHYSNKSRPFGILKASLEDSIKDENQRLNQLKAELQQLQLKGQSFCTERETNRRLETGLSEKIRRKLGAKKKLSMKLTQLHNAREEEEEPEQDIATYESEIAELDEQIAARESERTAQEEVVSRIKDELEEINQRSRQTDIKVEQVAARHEELRARIEESDNKKKQAEKRLKTCEGRIAEINAQIASLEENLLKRQEELQEAVTTAEEGSERVETDKSRRDISSEIRLLKQHISKDQPSLEEQEKMQKTYTDAMEKYEKHLIIHKKLKKTLRELKRSLTNRITNYQKLQERVATRASHYFTFFLRQRDYDGKLKFNHPKEQLIIEVQVDSHTQQSQATSNAKQLSGGERSYTTVCFIMALWDAIQAPFRCLDEFDVFMDMVNRKISMRMMMQLAEDKPTRQFLFFTPQDMSSMGVTGSKMVKVLRLQEPVRGGQATLDQLNN